MDILQELLSELVKFVPKILGAIVIIIVAMIAIRIITKVIRNLLDKIGIDTLADTTINKVDMLESNNIKLVPSIFISTILYYFLLLIALVAATDVLQMAAISDLVKGAVDYIPVLLTALVLLVIGLFIADLVRSATQSAMESLNVPAAKFIASFIFYFIFISVLILALEQAKINTGFLTSNLSIILGGVVFAFAIGYGFASRALMASYIAHFYSRDKIKIGDIIQIDEKTGKVVDIGNTSMTLQSIETGTKIIVPLSRLNTETIEVIESTPNSEED